MKYFVSTDKTERHVIDEHHVALLPVDLIEISKAEYDELVNESNKKTDEQKLDEFKASVQAALDASDLVALRAYKAGVAFGPEWTAYDASLRKLKSVSAFSDDLLLPTKPTTYPS